MENVNPYNDDAYTASSGKARNALVGLWEAGASLTDIETVIEDALDDASVQVDCTLEPR